MNEAEGATAVRERAAASAFCLGVWDYQRRHALASDRAGTLCSSTGGAARISRGRSYRSRRDHYRRRRPRRPCQGCADGAAEGFAVAGCEGGLVRGSALGF